MSDNEVDCSLLLALSAFGRALAKSSPDINGAMIDDIKIKGDGVCLCIRPPGMLGKLGALSVHIKVVETSDSYTLLGLKLPAALESILGGESVLEKMLEKFLAENKKQLPPGCTLQNGMLRVEHQATADYLLKNKPVRLN